MLVCCGLVTVDVVQVVERFPAANEKVRAVDASIEFGGPAANAAATASALGVPATLISRVGGAGLGSIAAEGLRAAGVRVVDVAEPDDAPPVSTVVVTRATGERAVVSTNAVSSGAQSAAPAAPDVADAVEAALAGLGPADVVLLDGHHVDLAERVARHARQVGARTVLDGGSFKPGTPELLGWCDVVLLSEDFRMPAVAEEGTLDAAAAAMRPGTVVARSRGHRAIEVLDADGRHEVGVPEATVVDTLGAGDVLHGALAAWLASGATVLTSIERAAEVATASVEHPGALGWVGVNGGFSGFLEA
ncbi:ribokinase [Paraoerskovia sediminicola]|uniref:Ribokinase n=1 Tax=Paraoerskovia sediminicola TaxID=1138587 RepID=A0ABM8FZ30_9CELL|nr:PfkB family carbohydrate kinase [Paraoerskovia sediminicola]BDZ40869.1 ribokinase [Paraoerskovia sediminicola]